MTTWLEWKEKVLQYQGFLQWRIPLIQLVTKTPPTLPPLNPLRILKMAKSPSATSVSLEALETRYSARFFRAALARYVVLLSEPGITVASRLEEHASQLRFSFDKVSVYHKIRFIDSDSNSTLDSIHARPQLVRNILGRVNQTSPARFDVALVYIGPGHVNDIQSEQIASTISLSIITSDMFISQTGESARSALCSLYLSAIHQSFSIMVPGLPNTLPTSNGSRHSHVQPNQIRCCISSHALNVATKRLLVLFQ